MIQTFAIQPALSAGSGCMSSAKGIGWATIVALSFFTLPLHLLKRSFPFASLSTSFIEESTGELHHVD